MLSVLSWFSAPLRQAQGRHRKPRQNCFCHSIIPQPKGRGYFFPYIIILPEKTGQALCVNFALSWVFHIVMITFPLLWPLSTYLCASTISSNEYCLSMTVFSFPASQSSLRKIRSSGLSCIPFDELSPSR